MAKGEGQRQGEKDGWQVEPAHGNQGNGDLRNDIEDGQKAEGKGRRREHQETLPPKAIEPNPEEAQSRQGQKGSKPSGVRIGHMEL
jgi:hypothetical protein